MARSCAFGIDPLVGVRAVGLATLIMATAAGARADAPVQLRTVALTGEHAPGTDAGVNFAAFTTPLNHSIMHSVIDEQGRVAFIATLQGPGVVDGNRSGIWSESAAPLSLVVRTGSPAPGTPAGVVFTGVPSEYIPIPPSFAIGRAAFFGEIAGPGVSSANNFGIWAEQPAEPALIARQGNPAPGTAAGVVFATVNLVGIDESGHVMLTGTLSGPGVTTNNNEGVWSDRSGTLALIAREGDPAPGAGSGVTLGLGVFANSATFELIAFNRQSLLAVQANLLGPGVDAFNDEAIFAENAQTGALTLIAREGDQAPGMPGNQDFGGNSVTAQFMGLTLDDAGHVAFMARVGPSANMVMFSNHNGPLAPVYIPGEPAPGTDFDFGISGGPVFSDNGLIAFRAAVPDSDTDPFTPPLFGIFSDRDGELAPVELPGQTVTHNGLVWTLGGTSFIAGFSTAGEIAYTSDISRPEVPYPRYALVVSSPPALTHVIVAEGEEIDVAGDGSDVREVIRLVHGGMGEGGQVAFRLDFADGSSGHFSGVVDCDGNGISDARDIADGTMIDADGNGIPDVCEGMAGDANCDGVVNLSDVVPFALALVDPTAFANAFLGCPLLRADTSGDGLANGHDVAPFTALLVGP